MSTLLHNVYVMIQQKAEYFKTSKVTVKISGINVQTKQNGHSTDWKLMYKVRSEITGYADFGVGRNRRMPLLK